MWTATGRWYSPSEKVSSRWLMRTAVRLLVDTRSNQVDGEMSKHS